MTVEEEAARDREEGWDTGRQETRVIYKENSSLFRADREFEARRGELSSRPTGVRYRYYQ